MSAHYRDAVADLFTSKPHTWIDGLEIGTVGGVYAYRTRISECRRQLGMTIQNRVITLPSGSRRSEYMFLPSPPAQSLIELFEEAR